MTTRAAGGVYERAGGKQHASYAAYWRERENAGRRFGTLGTSTLSQAPLAAPDSWRRSRQPGRHPSAPNGQGAGGARPYGAEGLHHTPRSPSLLLPNSDGIFSGDAATCAAPARTILHCYSWTLTISSVCCARFLLPLLAPLIPARPHSQLLPLVTLAWCISSFRRCLFQTWRTRACMPMLKIVLGCAPWR